MEKLKTSTRQVEGVTIVDRSGRITLGEASVVVRDVINDLMGKGNKKILLNLGKVDYIDSSDAQQPCNETGPAHPHEVGRLSEHVFTLSSKT